ncbi:hypothetical protein QVD17_01648 [Tagetes erecta]|uniref:Myb-like domain-containing protein n=1 Tax=Tagetes erecta TaxID=13708 RepID=A0AAD8LAZ5_TARER|nr:hypothetical protein QVD17_01648 [Tagetes erecta]
MKKMMTVGECEKGGGDVKEGNEGGGGGRSGEAMKKMACLVCSKPATESKRFRCCISSACFAGEIDLTELDIGSEHASERKRCWNKSEQWSCGGKEFEPKLHPHARQTLNSFSRFHHLLHRIFTFIDLLLHHLVASSSSSTKNIDLLLHHLLPPRTSSCCFIITFTFISRCRHLSEKNDESKQVQRSNVLTFAVSHLTVIDVWIDEEVDRFYKANRKYGKDWKKVAAMVRTRHPEMVEALYTMNRAYLSLPEGTTSVVGFIAMVSDHYNAMLTACIRFVIR